jgi:spoIIIJ-associated protein
MSEYDETIFSGQSVDEAIAIALAELGLSREDVEIEILEEGAKGLFGLGGREARVRVSPLTEAPPADEPAGEEFEDEPETPDGEDSEAELARQVVIELLHKMHVTAQVTAALENQPGEHRPTITVNIAGDDLSFLIGRKAETLDALQYIARLILGKELNRGVTLIVDVQGYKARRIESIKKMAHTFAKQAVDTGRRQHLEPMPADERRIIHIELRDHPDVFTESIGEGERRKVTINPKHS